MRARRAVCLGGRKPANKNWSVGKPATVSAANGADAPGSAVTAISGFLRGTNQLEPGIGHQRRAGIRHQCDGGALGEPLQQFGPRRRGVVVVVGRERRGDGIAVEQLARHARILAGDQVGARQRCERPQA